MLLGLLLTTQTLLILGMAALLTVLAVSIWYRRDTEREERRRKYILVAQFLKDRMPRLAEVFEDLAVGDYSGVWITSRGLAKDLADPETAKALVGQWFYRELQLRLGDDEDVAKIEAAVGVEPEPPAKAA